MTKARDLASGNPAPSTVSTTELGYVDGVTSAIQTQINNKLDTSTASSTYLTSATAGTTYQTKATTGLVLLNTTSFSGVSSFSLAADTFTSTYETYKLIVTLTGTSADSEFFVRLRASGSDNSTANYNNANTSFRSNNTANNYGSAGQTAFTVGQSEAAFSANANFYYDIDIVQPKLAVNTKLSYRGQDTDGSSNYVNRSGGGLFNATTQFDSASFYVGSGTFGGKYSVYGYNL